MGASIALLVKALEAADYNLAAAISAMADGAHSVVFVAGSTDGWLQRNIDDNQKTPDQAVRLAGQNSLAAFDKNDLMSLDCVTRRRRTYARGCTGKELDNSPVPRHPNG